MIPETNAYSIEALATAAAMLTPQEQADRLAAVDSALIGADASDLTADHLAHGNLHAAARWYRTALHHHADGARRALDDIEVLVQTPHTPDAEHIIEGIPFKPRDAEQRREAALANAADAVRDAHCAADRIRADAQQVALHAEDQARHLVDDARAEAERLIAEARHNIRRPREGHQPAADDRTTVENDSPDIHRFDQAWGVLARLAPSKTGTPTGPLLLQELRELVMLLRATSHEAEAAWARSAVTLQEDVERAIARPGGLKPDELVDMLARMHMLLTTSPDAANTHDMQQSASDHLAEDAPELLFDDTSHSPDVAVQPSQAPADDVAAASRTPVPSREVEPGVRRSTTPFARSRQQAVAQVRAVLSTRPQRPLELREEEWERPALPRWRPCAVVNDLDEVFRARFDKLSARPVQRAAVEEAVRLAESGIVVIEAPMGSGKTEAALLAAEVLAHRSGADGYFIALPTQATADAMLSRVRHWFDRLPGDETVSTTLAHRKAHLDDEYSDLARRNLHLGVGEINDNRAILRQWINGSKKGRLAYFVVGAINQVLFAGLKSRHLMLQHLALAGKVVIIDEVHAYDVYMSRYLHHVLHWLGSYGAPVVLLSTTLPDAYRAELVRAYAEGKGAMATITDGHLGYPAITSMGGSTMIEAVAESTLVKVDRLADDLDTLVRYLRENLADGGCVVVVRNTVARVQEAAARLVKEFGVKVVTIAHSRFLACDRAAIDRSLAQRFGPFGDHRPGLHIVVASQVVEHSLDLDFDLMVTDLAPVDLILQRLGRLHRHDHIRPTGMRTSRCAVVGVEDWAAAPVVSVAGSRRVFDDHTLLRSAALLADRDTIVLPDDIAPLVQSAYGPTALGPDSWQPAMRAAATQTEALSQWRTDSAATFLADRATNRGTPMGWLIASEGNAKGEAKGAAQTRDGKKPLEVLVVQRDADGRLLLPDWIKGGREQIPEYERVPWTQAKIISTCSLRLPMALSHGGVIAELEKTRIASFDLTPLLAGQLILVLDDNRKAVLYGHHLTYDPHRGLLHERARPIL
ncbi:CRISPR-associated helicase Cas3 [Actinokineospora spheciospongiae]|uniref:CRISPR-associated helicase Cas3 n=1 Tax=Actinokineospora spheciospongiae TaxID=909613 RepID=W7IVS6_9PSEU|nr:CRISPR-associated helicase Cas3' [Actinokineospora spheciospongiae]EWC64458.1 CRISPR-associated helicase Cas3 [Actinokineospora spheciospongiae]